jgi:hypothetical protein
VVQTTLARLKKTKKLMGGTQLKKSIESSKKTKLIQQWRIEKAINTLSDI